MHTHFRLLNVIRNSQHKQRFPYWHNGKQAPFCSQNGVFYFILQSFPIMGQINGTNCTQMEHLLCLLQQSHFQQPYYTTSYIREPTKKSGWSSFFAHLCICSIFTIITFTTITLDGGKHPLSKYKGHR